MYRRLLAILAFTASTSYAGDNQAVCKKYDGEIFRLQKASLDGWAEFCRIGDGPYWGSGAIIGAQTLRDFDDGVSTLAVEVFLKHERAEPFPAAHSVGNPAVDYCKQLGGKVDNYLSVFRGENIGETGFCTFSDGSMIDQWDLLVHDQTLQTIFTDQTQARSPVPSL